MAFKKSRATRTQLLIRYMQGWEEFATRVLGNIEHTYDLVNEAVKEAENGAVIVYPMWIWTAKAVELSSKTGKGKVATDGK